jgi:hypothetical protein
LKAASKDEGGRRKTREERERTREERERTRLTRTVVEVIAVVGV